LTPRGQAQGLRTVAAAIPLGEADEEALLGREAVPRLELLVLRLLLPGQIGEDGPSQVGHVLPQGELAERSNCG
jgi:hypothetical protein